MKETLRKLVISILISSTLGSSCGILIYKIYFSDNILSLENNTIYLIQSGAYSSYDNMRASAINYSYIYYEEDNLYKTIIGITKSKDNINKIKEVYGNDVVVNTYYNDDELLNSKLLEYDRLLNDAKDVEEEKKIIIEMLNLYKKDDKIKLTKISWYIKILIINDNQDKKYKEQAKI